MRKTFAFVVGLVLLSTPPAFAQAMSSASSAKDPVITIDGSKNPELIPEWAAWGYEFRMLGRSLDGAPKRGVPESEQLPTDLLRAVSKDQIPEIIERIRAAVAREQAYTSRAVKLLGDHPEGQAPTPANTVTRDKMRELELARRQDTLQARDELLASLSTDGQIALRRLVDADKLGMKFTLRQSERAFFHLPE